LNTRSTPTERTVAAIFFSGATYFMHFFALGFGSFPLQTHLRHALTPPTASLVASIVPLAACSTYFLFRFAQSQGWMRSPRLVLFGAAVGMGLIQLLLGWRMHHASLGNFFVGPFVDIALCMLLLGCVQSSVMTLLNHIGVSTMGDYAYTVRAAGSAGYMAALLLMGSLSKDDAQIADYHLFLGACVSVIHASIAFFAWRMLPKESDLHELHPAKTEPSGGDRFRPSSSDRFTPSSNTSGSSQQSINWEWMGLLLLVWVMAICEMSYGLYAHEFLTQTYGSYGYFVFALAVAIEIGVLIAMPYFPSLKRKLLFVGPVGWILLLSGCLLATQGMPAFGLFGLTLALNCPFQISTNEHAHRMNPSVMGIASMTLAQSLGYMTATVIASIASRFYTGPGLLWLLVLPLAGLALVLAIRKLARQDALLDVDDFCESSGMAGGGIVPCPQERADDFEGQFRSDHTGSDAENVHVVVLDALPSGVSVVAKTGSNARELVRRHAHANS